jgi:phenylalanyl-tRNA synthetase beta chain
MNISIPHSWLKVYLTTDATPQKIAECLSLCGPSVEQLEKIKEDFIYHLEITTNRVDMMSVRGIAREAAAILPHFGFSARLKLNDPPEIETPTPSLPLTIIDKDHLCHRILAVILDNVDLKPSSKKIQDRLKAVGIRSLNNVVDVTNYVMTDIGHPTHVFDYDRIKPKKFIIRTSRAGETVVSLDDKKHTLPGGDVVIDDGSGEIIDLPGIIGMANSVVTDTTKRIILFIETSNPIKIRKTSMTLGIRTIAATLGEKDLDPEMALIALKRGVQLFKKLTGASVASKVYDLYPLPFKRKAVTAPLDLIRQRLEVEISQKEVDKILQSLGFVNGQVPSWRAKDINIPEDIVEEVARVYGYHRLPSYLMATPIPTNYPDENFVLENKIKSWLAGMGLNEIYTNSMVSAELAQQSGIPLNEHLKIKNALSSEWQYLRRSILPQHTQNFPAFEMANTYQSRSGDLPEQRLELVISGFEEFSKLKGVVDALFAKLHLPVEAELTQTAAVINLRPILKKATLYPAYQPLSLFAPVIEDLTFTLPVQTYIGPVITMIKHADKLIAGVELVEIYQQNHTFRITYQSHKKQLSAEMISPLRKKIVAILKTKFKAQLVGELN